MDNKFSSKEFWKDKFGEYPQTDCEKLAVSMMKEYLDYWLLPNISKSTENLSKIKDKDEWLNKIRGNETNSSR